MEYEENDALVMWDKLDSILNNVDLSDVTPGGVGYEDMPDGYYLCEVESAEIKESKSSHNPMAAFVLKVLENGIDADPSSDEVHLTEIKSTKNRKIYQYYVLRDDKSVKRFVRDMLKFEGAVAGESLLPKEAFLSSETIRDALEVLVGMRIYVQVSTTYKDDIKSTWRNLVSWKRAKALNLPL